MSLAFNKGSAEFEKLAVSLDLAAPTWTNLLTLARF
jgi:hypothetical protein